MLLELFNSMLKVSEFFQMPKSLKDAPNMSVSLFQKKEMEKEIQKIYEQYKIFMKNIEMPNCVIHFKQKKNDNLELASVEYEQEKYHLYVSDVAYNSNVRKEVLFHEFTHIYDTEILDKNYAYRKGTKKHDDVHMFLQKSTRSR